MQSHKLAYIIITPHSIVKSRTGAILARLLNNVKSKLVTSQIFAPTKELAEKYAANIKVGSATEDKYRELLSNYVLKNFSPSLDGSKKRVLMLVFHGDNAREELQSVVGHLQIQSHQGETIRDSFGDLIWNDDGSIHYFEPALLLSNPTGNISENLKLWLDFAKQENAVLGKICKYATKVEKTLVLIKPDSWKTHSLRPGAIIDMFSKAGLRIMGFNVLRMSIAQAKEFYGPVENALCEKLAPAIGKKAKVLLEEKFKFKLPESSIDSLVQSVGIPYAIDQYKSIVRFMSGKNPDEESNNNQNEDGNASILGLVYEGENAVNKIRAILGPTDPSKAPSGTVRKEFGYDVMINTAHASDSAENAKREMGIIGMHDGTFVKIVDSLLKKYTSE